MTIKKTLRALAVGGLLLLGAGTLRPAFAWVSVAIDTSTVVNVSSQPTAPSTIVAPFQGSYATVEIWCRQLANPGETICINGTSTGISTATLTGTASITCTTTTALGEHLILTDYVGPLYGVTRSTYTIPLQVIRRK